MDSNAITKLIHELIPNYLSTLKLDRDFRVMRRGGKSRFIDAALLSNSSLIVDKVKTVNPSRIQPAYAIHLGWIRRVFARDSTKIQEESDAVRRRHYAQSMLATRLLSLFKGRTEGRRPRWRIPFLIPFVFHPLAREPRRRDEGSTVTVASLRTRLDGTDATHTRAVSSLSTLYLG